MGSPKSLGFIIWEPCMSVDDLLLMAVYEKSVFESGSIDRLSYAVCGAVLLAWLKNRTCHVL